ncbi:hypothetical protein DIPPA_14301 [Diplonema papillatum]|nr:hypothetical protein DIPPA_14301 [Diplonema papillatum]
MLPHAWRRLAIACAASPGMCAHRANRLLVLSAQTLEFFGNGTLLGVAFAHVSRHCYPAVSLTFPSRVPAP